MNDDKIEKILKNIDKFIDSIEQLGADARFYYNKEQYNRLKVQIMSIEQYSEDILKYLARLEKLNNGE